MSLIDNNDTILIARKQSFQIRSKDTKERSMSASLDVLQYDRGRSPPSCTMHNLMMKSALT